MKPLACLSTVLAACLCLTGAERPRVGRAAVAAMEKSIDRRLETVVEDPFLLLGMTRGVYLESYGAVFTAEVNLASGPSISPFRPKISKDDIVKLRLKKLERLPALKSAMREALVAAAGSLDTVPAEERLVVGVSLFCFSWEDSSGLPSQIVMQAPRRTLLDFQTNRRDRSTLEAAVQVQEF
ncbi:MAG: hypothetical protein Q8N47_01035 [Bryobacterales bacterium]|nr:hypothetical protein [Bryobacterales bacterium]